MSELLNSQCESIPAEFSKIIIDFVSDIKTTFPEYEPFFNKWIKPQSFFNSIEDETDRYNSIDRSHKNSIKFIFEFCLKKYPPRFFDILYQKEEMFVDDSAINTEFLPYIHFKDLWQCDISEKTRNTIWKYLQLILFSIVGSIKSRDSFGDTAQMFDTVNEDEFKEKLEDTLSHIQLMFDDKATNQETNDKPEDRAMFGSNIDINNLPNADKIHTHISGMIDGKLGALAKEIAEETVTEMNMDMENVKDIKDVFENLFKNPGKLMNLVKIVGDKLDTRIKTGEIKETELMAEAGDIMNKMKDMPGMENLQSLLGQMGINNLEGFGKKTQKSERTKPTRNKTKTPRDVQIENMKPPLTDDDLYKLFDSVESVFKKKKGLPINSK